MTAFAAMQTSHGKANAVFNFWKDYILLNVPGNKTVENSSTV